MKPHLEPIAPGRKRPEPGLKRCGVPRKLDWAKVSMIRLLFATGLVSQTWLAGYFGVSGATIHAIVWGHTWIGRDRVNL